MRLADGMLWIKCWQKTQIYHSILSWYQNLFPFFFFTSWYLHTEKKSLDIPSEGRQVNLWYPTLPSFRRKNNKNAVCLLQKKTWSKCFCEPGCLCICVRALSPTKVLSHILQRWKRALGWVSPDTAQSLILSTALHFCLPSFTMED